MEALLTRLGVIGAILASGYLWFRSRRHEALDKRMKLEHDKAEAQAKRDAEADLAKKQNRKDAISEHVAMAEYWEKRFKEAEDRCDERIGKIETELAESRHNHHECREQLVRLEERVNDRMDKQAAAIGGVSERVAKLKRGEK